MTIGEAEAERDSLVWTVKLSDTNGISRIDYLRGWIDCYKQLNKPEAPLKVKDFPEKLREEIKKEVKRQCNNWDDIKEEYLNRAFIFGASKKGLNYWAEIENQYYGV